MQTLRHAVRIFPPWWFRHFSQGSQKKKRARIALFAGDGNTRSNTTKVRREICAFKARNTRHVYTLQCKTGAVAEERRRLNSLNCQPQDQIRASDNSGRGGVVQTQIENVKIMTVQTSAAISRI